MEKTTKQAFQSLKVALVSDAELMGPNFGESFTLQTDVSELGVEAVLGQLDEEGRKGLIAYHSRKLVVRRTT